MIVKIINTIKKLTSKLHLRTKIALGVIAVLLPIIIIAAILPGLGKAEWWNNSYEYRIPITITNNTTEETDVYVSFDDTDVLDTSGIGKFQADCGDIRFTKQSGEELPYYINSGCGTSNTDIDVNFNTFPAGSQVIYMYYGNPSASNGFESSGFTTEASNYSIDSIGSEEVGPGPIAFWKFDDPTSIPSGGSAGQAVQDSTEYDNDGILGSTANADSNDPIWTMEDMCISGRCLEYDGDNDYVDVDSNSSIQMKESMTVSAWFRMDAGATATQDIVSKYVFGSTKGYRIYYDSGSLIFKITDNSNYPADMVDFTPDGKWHHVVGVRDVDTDQITIYLDGQSSGSPTTDSTTGDLSSVQDLSIGVYSSRSTNFFNGFIDEVKIYPYARSAGQVKSDYLAGLASAGAAATIGSPDTSFLSDGLVGYWSMDEISGTAVADSSGNGNDGTLTNAQETGTSDATSSTTTLVDTDGSLSATDDAYNGMILSVPAATCAGLSGDEERIISDYTGATNTITVSTAFSGDLDSCTYTILHHVGGKFGNSTSYDGDNDRVVVSDTPELRFAAGDSVTLSAWINPSDISGTNNIVSKGRTDSGSENYGFRTTGSGKLQFYFKNSSDDRWMDYTTSAIVLTANSWQHVSVSFVFGSADSIRLYVNGSNFTGAWGDGDDGSADPYPSTDQLWFGANAVTTEDHEGKLDEVRIYNRALSPAEVAALYNWAPGPTGNWKLDEGSGNGYDAAKDTSGNGYHGDFVNLTEDSWTNGKIGNAVKFTGTDELISIADNDVWDRGLPYFTVGGWFKLDQTASDKGEDEVVILKLNSASPYISYALYIDSGDNLPYFTWTNNAGTTWSVNGTETISAGQWHYISGVRDEEGIKLYLDGVLLDSDNNPTGLTLNSSDELRFGANNTGGDRINGILDELKIYNYARTPAQILQDMKSTTSSVLGVTAGGIPHPIAHWGFDEQSGQTAHDTEGGNNGTLGNTSSESTDDPTWTSSGKRGGALSFDGGDYVDLNSSLNLSQPYSFSAWVKTSGGGAQNIIGNFNTNVRAGPYLMVSSGKLAFGDSGSLVGNKTINDGEWHHVSMTGYGSMVTLYVDGQIDNSGSVTLTPNTTDDFLIGARYTDSLPSQFFNGTIDEVKIYNFALTPEQVKQDYNAGSSVVLANDDEANNLADGAGNPPIAEWTFDEKTGTTAYDKSGNGNDGTISGASWTSGCKQGACLSFDGDDYTDVGSSSDFNMENSMTIEAWVKPSTVDGQDTIFSKMGASTDRGYYFIINSGELRLRGSDDGTDGNLVNYESSNADLQADTWYHVAVVKDGTGATLYKNGVSLTASGTVYSSYYSSSVNSWIGAYAGSPTSATFTGQIDHVKIYDYARTPAQIAYDYNRGGPVAHYRFDECEGNTIHDVSGNGNDGTLTVTTAGGNTAGVGTCQTSNSAWGNGASGKYSSSLSFDGDGDYIEIVDPGTSSIFDLTEAISISAWIKTTNDGVIVAKYDDSSLAYEIAVVSGKGDVRIGTTGTSSVRIHPNGVKSINDGQWHHIVGTYDRQNIKLYIDGELDQSQPHTGSIQTNNVNLTIARRLHTQSTYLNDGQIDEVQIFNYALSADQVKKLYNGGYAVFFKE